MKETMQLSELGVSVDGLDFDTLSNMEAGQGLLSSSPDDERIQKIVDHLIKTGDETQHVYTRDINIKGRAVQEAMDKYLEDRHHLSSSVLSMASKSPLHLYYEYESGWKQELDKLQKKEGYFDLGTYLHECFLEPTKFSRVVVEPQANRASKEGVNTLCTFWEEIITEEYQDEPAEGFAESLINQACNGVDLEKMAGMKEYYTNLKASSKSEAVRGDHKIIIDAVKYNYMAYHDRVIPRMLKHSKREISMYYLDPETGLKLKIRPDAIAFEENIGVNAIISFKSTSSDNLMQFAYQCAKLNYPMKEAMYQEVASKVTGRNFDTTILLMMQSVPPYGVAMLVYSRDDIEAGHYRYMNAKQTAMECISKNRYPGYEVFAEEGNMGLIGLNMPEFYRSVSEKPVNI